VHFKVEKEGGKAREMQEKRKVVRSLKVLPENGIKVVLVRPLVS
jgi:hypothetical protein